MERKYIELSFQEWYWHTKREQKPILDAAHLSKIQFTDLQLENGSYREPNF
jgi:hypothetical protein